MVTKADFWHLPRSVEDGRKWPMSWNFAFVDPTSHNANHTPRLEVETPAASIPRHDGRQAPSTRQLHRDRTRQRHQDDPAFHELALRGLSSGRRQRALSSDILAAISDFERRHGRWPAQKDFRSENGLPGCATLWSRFGSIAAAVELAGRNRLGNV